MNLHRILSGSPEHKRELAAAGLFVLFWFAMDVIQFVDWAAQKFNAPAPVFREGAYMQQSCVSDGAGWTQCSDGAGWTQRSDGAGWTQRKKLNSKPSAEAPEQERTYTIWTGHTYGSKCFVAPLVTSTLTKVVLVHEGKSVPIVDKTNKLFVSGIPYNEEGEQYVLLQDGDTLTATYSRALSWQEADKIRKCGDF